MCGAAPSQVRQYEVEASSDYRFNYKLLKACKEDVNSLCALACDADQGKVSHANADDVVTVA